MAHPTMNVQSASGISRGWISSGTRGSTQQKHSSSRINSAMALARSTVIASAPAGPAPATPTSSSGSLSHCANCSGPGRRALITIPDGSARSTVSDAARPFAFHSSAFTLAFLSPYNVS